MTPPQPVLTGPETPVGTVTRTNDQALGRKKDHE